ncbi:hypothetical protein CU086_00135 [Candidatus Nasuia deltocephalinicola]|uniref:cytochrome-c oxidase n=1 Tax=Candidatus Nasuia deltocephalincola TaxID=1160784 RepID=A0A974WPG5_9PROT|nr:hypothetical protein CU086_00135 [Candidatus Nasuia deltocephalinicola]
MHFYKIFKLNIPVTNFFFEIYKFNNFIFIIFYLFLLFFIIFFFTFIFHNFFLKNNKYIFIKSFFFEFFWVLLPFYSISYIFFYSIFVILKIKKFYNNYLNIKIISYQWKWYYIYLDNFNFNFFSIISNCIFNILNFDFKNKYNKNYFQKVDNKLILPLNKFIRFILISNDVIHSIYIPSFGIKQDLIPSFLKIFYFKPLKLGKFFGFCSEMCGKNHSYMPIILKVLPFYNYKKWLICFFLKKNFF